MRLRIVLGRGDGLHLSNHARMIPSAIAVTLKRRVKGDFKDRHYEAVLIVQAVSWYLRYPLNDRDVEKLFSKRRVGVDHSTLNRWVLAYVPSIEKRPRQFRTPHCEPVRISEPVR